MDRKDFLKKGLLGTGMFSIVVILAGALVGTYVYGMVKDKLPH